jgi:hypothetical protein
MEPAPMPCLSPISAEIGFSGSNRLNLSERGKDNGNWCLLRTPRPVVTIVNLDEILAFGSEFMFGASAMRPVIFPTLPAAWHPSLTAIKPKLTLGKGDIS